MILYRIARCTYANDLSGTGARLFGGRWNSIGKPATYLASSCSLAMLEVLVHLQPLMVPNDFCLVEVEVPDKHILTITTDILPKDWKDVSPPQILARIGDDFLKKQEYFMLKVPSAIVPEEYNYLLNPMHPDMKKVKVINTESFDFDSRLV
ncbi:RES family NAD+ phosphorylase [Mucilaginibacter flavidus]|uniref:RES family NAD+ phosphorylase n=1 Tax=Mucilaginibacter flavidus TaxID=2949309 RepID=UPI0020927DF4|nr:RES domain-containing protein [Mucilaginibacter flavidus]MCO5945303.1 RES domain-containing protein [Mucilaginibacter flavidus]